MKQAGNEIWRVGSHEEHPEIGIGLYEFCSLWMNPSFRDKCSAQTEMVVSAVSGLVLLRLLMELRNIFFQRLTRVTHSGASTILLSFRNLSRTSSFIDLPLRDTQCTSYDF